MRILFEGYKYQTKDVENALSGLLSKIDLSQTEQQLKCVGYYYDKNAVNADGTIGDLVFILPKVLLDKENKAFGLAPNDLINFNLKEWNVENETVGNLTKKKIHDFIYGFSSWFVLFLLSMALIAYCAFVALWVTKYTCPNDPAPNSFMIWKSVIFGSGSNPLATVSEKKKNLFFTLFFSIFIALIFLFYLF